MWGYIAVFLIGYVLGMIMIAIMAASGRSSDAEEHK